MKHITYSFFILFLFASMHVSAQFEGMIVEKYYISSVGDTTDPSGARLPDSSCTYRIFLNLEKGVKIKSLYADANHPLIILSTENFFNHLFATSSYGYKVNQLLLKIPGSNPVCPANLPLDSWLTIGFASDKHLGVLKSEDPDSSIFTEGLKTNNHDSAGIPLSEKDGMVLADTSFDEYTISSNIETGCTPFSKDSVGNLFTTTKPVLFSTKGFSSVDTSNIILVGQITTHGKLSFRINMELIDENGKKYRYVSKDTLTGTFSIGGTSEKINVIYSNRLIFPPKKGCTNPYFICYDTDALINDGSCQQCDSIKFGCKDVRACNYDENANFHLKELCCYGPDSCDNRNINKVCPGYLKSKQINISLYPQPVQKNNDLHVKLFSPEQTEADLFIYDIYGIKTYNDHLFLPKNTSRHSVNIYGMKKGMYIMHINTSSQQVSKKFFIE